MLSRLIDVYIRPNVREQQPRRMQTFSFEYTARPNLSLRLILNSTASSLVPIAAQLSIPAVLSPT